MRKFNYGSTEPSTKIDPNGANYMQQCSKKINKTLITLAETSLISKLRLLKKV